LHKSEEDAVEALYALCGITSRTELNGNSEAKQKFDRFPSAYASAWIVKTYKARGGGYK
jgi:hypothetical protein